METAAGPGTSLESAKCRKSSVPPRGYGCAPHAGRVPVPECRRASSAPARRTRELARISCEGNGSTRLTAAATGELLPSPKNCAHRQVANKLIASVDEE